MSQEQPATIPDTVWKLVQTYGQSIEVEAGQLLWQSGDFRTEHFYLVTRGLLRLFHDTSSAKVVTLLAIGPGGILGHHHNPKIKTHVTGAEAVTYSKLLAFPSDKLAHLLQQTDDLGRAFTFWFRDQLFLQLAESNTRLELEHDSAKVKVAHILLALDRQGYLDRIDRQHIADLANLTVETTVRTLSQLLREGILKTSHFTTLQETERLALADLLEPYEATELPYS
ncbi:MAG: Crp/Fnr family transcriptional regulator [Trueperaceae bacterium]|nr:Crp/Fnr family transcriptional regulator [Trueperaceae bacterium]